MAGLLFCFIGVDGGKDTRLLNMVVPRLPKGASILSFEEVLIKSALVLRGVESVIGSGLGLFARYGLKSYVKNNTIGHFQMF